MFVQNVDIASTCLATGNSILTSISLNISLYFIQVISTTHPYTSFASHNELIFKALYSDFKILLGH